MKKVVAVVMDNRTQMTIFTVEHPSKTSNRRDGIFG